MTDDMIEEIFDNAFVSVSKSLASMRLRRGMADDANLGRVFRIAIYTTGNFDSYILCEVNPRLFEYIVYQMNGGSPPDPDEKPLYINEYINIVCGQAVSAINNKTGNASRLSVPSFYAHDEVVVELSEKKHKVFYYDTENGGMKISIYYSFCRKDQRRMGNGKDNYNGGR